MRGSHVDSLGGSRFYPTTNHAMARKQKGVKLVFVDDGQFKITPEWGYLYRFPHLIMCRLIRSCGQLRASTEVWRAGRSG
jgi:hypothetical protein